MASPRSTRPTSGRSRTRVRENSAPETETSWRSMCSTFKVTRNIGHAAIAVMAGSDHRRERAANTVSSGWGRSPVRFNAQRGCHAADGGRPTRGVAAGHASDRATSGHGHKQLVNLGRKSSEVPLPRLDDKGTPVVRLVRKATGLEGVSRVTEVSRSWIPPGRGPMRVRRCAAYVATTISIALPSAMAIAPTGAAAAPSFAHWSVRSLTVSDRTGDPGWHEATRKAVDTWNAVGADLHLAWVEGGVGCEAEGSTIPVCRDLLQDGWKGAAAVYNTADGHLGGARIRVAADRPFTQAQRDTIACHELGHALGLGHSGSATSCLTQGSQSITPDAADAESLRTSYAHGS